ncbi:MAG TPA: outer membrane protein assembly factor [Sulfurovum sp. UBA12169]|nr:MAG TPA: outer membrane protein assembly factor [Sulfurovum sp. UBA12169]
MNYKQILFFALFLSGLCSAKETPLPTHTIHISGQKAFEEAKLYDALSADTKSFFQFWKEDTPRIKDKLIPTLDPTLKSFYDSEGFYDANFTIKETNTSVTIKINENSPVLVNDIAISSDYSIAEYVTFKKGERFRAKEFVRIKNEIISALLKDGYCSYDLDTKAYVDLESHRVDLRYALKKGDICVFDQTNIKGLKTIDEKIVLSRIAAKEGERFDTRRIEQTYANLYMLDAFDSVIVNSNRKFYNKVPIDIVLSEVRKPYHLETGAGYDTYVGARVHSEVTKKNFMGDAQKIKLQISWSQKEELLQLDFFKPAWFDLFGYYLDFGAVAGYSNLEYDGFMEKKEYTRAYFEHEHEKLKLRAGVALENIDIALIDNLADNQVLQQAINDGTFLLFYPYFEGIYDARDSKLNPKYGYYLSGYFEYGVPYSDEASVYEKLLIEGRYIYSFGNLTLAGVAKAGVIDQTSNEIPESKLFFGGGSFSNRAYGFREIGVILSPTEESIEGASSMLNFSFEADYPIWGDFYGAVFTDNTMLTKESYDFSGDFITSAGAGVRYMTPIGPIKMDIGVNVHDPSQYGISFQIGQSF